ncbi:hypothetical protein C1645_858079 [Glomus cerebriforme]|uniref:Uncharacterized protein n=1 Tax=Glomus cerebriforme TaxID=658196 RepID=A0A397SKM9_9GLOM|nr:hypothetical protein C1645_858079 [Glomus cerebriforme]
MSNENYYNYIDEFIDLKNSIISPVSNIIKYESSSLTIFFKELLQELYIYLLNMEIRDIDQLNEIINNYLLDYDFDPINVLEIMTSCSQNIFYHSSLIGYFYQHGIGCEVDEIKAFKIYSDAINAINNNQKSETITFCNNDIKKLNEIILQYFYSLFFYKDIMSDKRNIYKLHIKNAEKGDNVSQYYVGEYYYHCKNIKQNFDKATEWYTKSSGGGNIRAMFMLGVCYYYGLGVIEDENKSFEFYLKSAEGGYKDASYFVGNCYHHGRSILKDERKAFEFYLRAAEKGVGWCQYLVANYYNEGKYIPKNKEKGFYWNRKAAINGISEAQYKLAEDYLNNSINKDEKKAFKWYLKLAANKYRLRAIYLVAKCYRDGIGTDKNLEESIKWFEKYAHKLSITLNDFLNGSDINAFEISEFA